MMNAGTARQVPNCGPDGLEAPVSVVFVAVHEDAVRPEAEQARGGQGVEVGPQQRGVPGLHSVQLSD